MDDTQQLATRSYVASAVHHRASRWRRTVAGWSGYTDLVRGRRVVSVNLGNSQRGMNTYVSFRNE
jgi:hypothetical protein